ncbi:hypothetical protein ACLESO_05995 [Pyxidicoccus sp. 3LG]
MRSWFILCVSLVSLVAGAAPLEVEAFSTPGQFAPHFAEREQLFGDVAHYRMRVRVGQGAHDFITLHRVVREDRPWRPERARKAVFMVHGDGWGFESAFLSSVGSASMPVDHSLAAFLAKEGVDVWGIDLRWVGVPVETTDFSFMADWDLGTHVEDVGTGLGIAKLVRLATGSVGGSMHLMGWSRGAVVSYAYLSAEARLPRGLRQVDGFIPVDMAVRFAPEHSAQKTWACERYEALRKKQVEEHQVEGGLLGAAPGRTLQGIGYLAATAPDAPSNLPADVFGPGTGVPTNRRVAIVAAAATGALMAGFMPITPNYHLFAGVPDATGLPGGLAFTNEAYLYEFAMRSAPYQSFNEVVETEAWACGLGTPYDDHLDRVKVPVLYVGAAGGVGIYGLHSVSLLGSQDVTVVIARTLPEQLRVLDYGHADLFLANDARERVWTPMLQWVRSH